MGDLGVRRVLARALVPGWAHRLRAGFRKGVLACVVRRTARNSWSWGCESVRKP